jgi:hypothetical protein
LVATINTNKHRKSTNQPTQSNISELTFLPESNSKQKGVAKRIETVGTGPPSYKSSDHHPSLKTESDFLLRFVLINGEISTHVKQLTSEREKMGAKRALIGERQHSHNRGQWVSRDGGGETVTGDMRGVGGVE